MPDIKDFRNENGLKHADAEKSGNAINPLISTLSKQRKNDRDDFKVMKNDARKKLPIVIDIIIALLLVAALAGAVAGAFYAFRYFTVDYETASVEYTVVLDQNVEGKLKNESVYCDVDGSSYYFGKIKSATMLENGSQILVISVSAKYKSDEGYFLNDEKLAVGRGYELRTGQSVKVSGTVVELVDKTVRQSTEVKGGK